MSAMSLHELLAGVVDSASSVPDLRIAGMTLDSRQVRKGDAFVALRGTQQHGMAFAAQAGEHGAAIVLAELRGPDDEKPAEFVPAVPVIWIKDLRNHLGLLAARFHGDPSRRMTVIGVTGTNGKTSVVQMLAQALNHLGERSASIGTLGAGLHGALVAGERTTPDVISLQALLAAFAARDVTHVAMEVSSHALDQGRVDAVAFDLALFTNLTRDHLDYHGSMKAYGAAKERLFACEALKAAVVNVDDAFGHGLAARLPARLTRLRVSLGGSQAEVRAAEVRAHAAGLSFRLYTPWGEADVDSGLLGRFNVSNLLLVAAALGALGTPFEAIVQTLAAVQPVPGRMSRLGGQAGQPLVVVDYAHTPDALEQALMSVRAHCNGRVICVFGCGGERDSGKRPQMGAIAERMADCVVVTDDNPRGEDGDAIVAQILRGMRHAGKARVQRDRAAAITWACHQAGADDVVLIAGKGHEATQEIAGAKRPFDDLAVARAQLEVRA